ncbi:MAG: polysaccharide biosynthesis protein, partial [Candidatus Muiribacteriaceae bacterium]
LILEAGVMSRGGEIFVFDMGEPLKITDIAQKMISLYSTDKDNINIKYTGLTKGEKLHEKLWFAHEHVTETSNNKIKKVCEREFWDYAKKISLIKKLMLSDLDAPSSEIITQISGIIRC